MKTVLAIAAVLSLASTAALAQDLASVRVGYADLNLDSAAGRIALDQRVERALRQVCPSDAGPVDLGRRAIVASCRRTAMASLEAQLAAIASGRAYAQAAAPAARR